jgi:ribosomal-protein-alanine N-acetyltransferase
VSAQAVRVVLRPMRLDDLAEVVQIDRQSFALPWPERSYRFELQENPASHMLVAESAGEAPTAVAGYIGFWLIADEAHISTLAVRPDLRGQGIGTELLRAALARARALGAESITLEVRPSNAQAIRLYERFGFEAVGRRPRYYRDNDEDALLMTRHGLQAAGRAEAE